MMSIARVRGHVKKGTIALEDLDRLLDVMGMTRSGD